MSHQQISSSKHSLGAAPRNQEEASKRQRISSTSPLIVVEDDDDQFSEGPQGLPMAVRVHILNFLEEEDLVQVTHVSKQFHQDCHEQGIQNKIVPVYEMKADYGSTAQMLHTLCVDKQNGKFQKYHRLKFVDVNNFDKISTKDAKRIVKKVRLTGVVSLDLSFPAHVQLRKSRAVLASVPAALSCILPDLREVNLSNTLATQKALCDFAKKCPLLKKVTWHRQLSNVFISGQDLKCKGDNLKEIYMDDSGFFTGGQSHMLRAIADMHTPAYRHMCIFLLCNQALERVSIRNAKVRNFMGALLPIPQMALVKFVLSTPTLRWFRSDLNEENIAMLKAKLPDIELVN